MGHETLVRLSVSRVSLKLTAGSFTSIHSSMKIAVCEADAAANKDKFSGVGRFRWGGGIRINCRTQTNFHP